MTRLALTMACGDYERTRALTDGTVKPEGIDLNCITLPPPECFWRMGRFKQFEVSEFSMSSYLIAREQGEPFIAIPIFPSRSFRHSYMFVRKDAGIERPEDLKGRKVGSPEYQLTALLWIRAILKHEYRVDASDLNWYTGGQQIAGRKERLDIPLPGNVQSIPEDETLEEWMEAGKIEALLSPRVPARLMKGPDAPVKRLFENHREVEKAYYQKTGFYPIMHTVVIRRDVYDRHPWVAQALFKAFVEAKEHYYRELDRISSSKYDLPWYTLHLQEARALLGNDLNPYGLRENRRILEAMQRFSVEQGFTSKPLPLDELFAHCAIHD
ncbi:MAG: ABC transporter substrate-binding protein [Firmicutes bacterium]|nr:ABC transporter substrate-binding protein [Bacillota bacterium]